MKPSDFQKTIQCQFDCKLKKVVCGIEVRVLDDDLAEAIKYLSEKDREILLMYFFLGMSDTEIGDRLKINRSTSFRSRKNSLEEIKKKLKENMNDE